MFGVGLFWIVVVVVVVGGNLTAGFLFPFLAKTVEMIYIFLMGLVLK